MSLPIGLIPCPEIQGRINEYFLGTTGESNIEALPALEYLNSPSNAGNIQTTVSPGNGKLRNLDIVYTPRILESQVIQAESRACLATEKYGELKATYSIDENDITQYKELISQQDLIRKCEDDRLYLASRIAAGIDAVERATATRSATQIATLFGSWSASAVTYFSIVADTLSVRTKTAGVFTPGALEAIDLATVMSGYSGGKVIFSGAALYEGYRNYLAGCCANSGLDVAQLMNLYGTAVAWDRRVAAALGNVSNNFLVMEPGALQFLYYNYNAASLTADFNAPYANMVMTSPRTGIPYDVRVVNACPGEYSIIVELASKTVAMPDDMFRTGDEFAGVNFVNKGVVNNA